MQTLIETSLGELEKGLYPHHKDLDQTEYGIESRYNTAPVGWRPITEAELAKSRWMHYAPKVREHRQIHQLLDGTHVPEHPELPGKEFGFLGVTMYWYSDGTGYAVQDLYWEGKLLYYAFGCEHSYKYITRERYAEVMGAKPMAYNGISECVFCGHIYIHPDSR